MIWSTTSKHKLGDRGYYCSFDTERFSDTVLCLVRLVQSWPKKSRAWRLTWSSSTYTLVSDYFPISTVNHSLGGLYAQFPKKRVVFHDGICTGLFLCHLLPCKLSPLHPTIAARICEHICHCSTITYSAFSAHFVKHEAAKSKLGQISDDLACDHITLIYSCLPQFCSKAIFLPVF